MNDRSQPNARQRALRAIAAFEALKGVAALAALIGVLDLAHHDVRHLAMELIGHFRLDPDSRYPSLLLHYADLLPGADLRLLVLIAIAYVLVRALEAYGLWTERAWGEALGTLSGGLYVPFEFEHLMHRPSLVAAVVLALNIAVVAFLVVQLLRERRAARDGA